MSARIKGVFSSSGGRVDGIRVNRFTLTDI
jgi:hypothetical protein